VDPLFIKVRFLNTHIAVATIQWCCPEMHVNGVANLSALVKHILNVTDNNRALIAEKQKSLDQGVFDYRQIEEPFANLRLMSDKTWKEIIQES